MYRSMINFTGALDGVGISELLKKIDYSKMNYDERINVVRELLNSTNFFKIYFDNYYNPNINNSTPLSENHNVCRFLECLSNYLLNSKDLLDEEKRKAPVYHFITSRDWFEHKMDREQSIQGLCETETGQHEEIIHLLMVKDEKNYKVPIVTKIHDKDLERQDEMGEILRDYNKMFANIERQLSNLTYETKGKRYLLTRAISSIKQDMEYVKKSYEGIFRFKLDSFKESTKYDTLDLIDFTNRNHVKNLLKFKDEGLKPDGDNMNILIYDFNRITDQTKLSPRETIVLDMYRDGYSISEIAAIEKITPQCVWNTIKIITNKVCKKAEELEKMYGKY